MVCPPVALALVRLTGAAGALSGGCAASTGGLPKQELPPMPPLPEDDPPEPDAAAEGASGGDAADESSAVGAGHASAAGQVPPDDVVSAAPELPPLPASLDAGEISRSTLYAILGDGIGRFLRRVRTEAHLTGGRFVGWRLLTLPSEDQALRIGDTVVRVNGQSIERPEQFKNVWDSMATSSELVLDVLREGRDGKVRYRIVD